MSLSPGQMLNNRYRIVKMLGQGGFGAVYRAWDANLALPVAIKENLETSPESQKQFAVEARLLASLSHPNLPRVGDYFFLPGQGQYLVMDYVEGEDLAEKLAAAGGPLPAQQVLTWILQVCDALIYLHSQQAPVIHRDIKPANIRITPKGKAMLVDFGIAKLYDPQLATTLGARAVTPGFSPNEQYTSAGQTDGRSDVYSLGATLYTMLTGQAPPEAPERSMGKALPAPRLLNPDLPPGLEKALLRALEPLPEKRFASVSEFRAALQSQAAPVQTVRVAPPAGRKSDIMPILASLGGLVALGGLLVFCAMLVFPLLQDRVDAQERALARETEMAALATALADLPEPTPTYTIQQSLAPAPRFLWAEDCDPRTDPRFCQVSSDLAIFNQFYAVVDGFDAELVYKIPTSLAEMTYYDVVVMSACCVDYSSQDLDLFKSYILNGGSVIVQADFYCCNSADESDPLTSQFGIHYVDSGNSWRSTSSLADHPVNSGVERLVLDGAALVVDPPAQGLAWADGQERIALYEERGALVAIASSHFEWGKDATGVDFSIIGEYDNFIFWRNLLSWLTERARQHKLPMTP